MSSDNWNDIYLNGFGCDIDWDCCPVTSGIAIAMMHARKVAIDIGREVYISKHPALPSGERYYRIATRAISEAYAVMTESLGDTKKDGEG